MDLFPLISAAADVATVPPRGTLDSILNVIVPLAVFVMFGFMIYQNFGKEIDALITWIKKQMAEKPQEQQVPVNNPYMADGVITFR
jgi:hypothetical protein